jgi:hypothetical protein
LLKLYLCMLPAPLLTFELYDDIVDARGNDHLLCQYLATLPTANYSTIECICALLLRISQKSALNKVYPSTQFYSQPCCTLQSFLSLVDSLWVRSVLEVMFIYFQSMSDLHMRNKDIRNF